MSAPVRSSDLAEWRRVQRRKRCQGVVTLLALSVAAGLSMGVGEKLLRLRVIKVVSSDRTVAAEVARKIALPPGANLLTTPVAEFAHQAERCPRVRRAAIRRDLPDTLVVTAEPRRPLLACRQGERYLLVDEEGVCLYWCRKPDRALLRVEGLGRLPAAVGSRVTGEWFERARQAAEGLRDADREQPWALDVSRPHDLALVAGCGARGVVGLDGDITKRAKLFAEVLEQLEAGGHRVGVVELRTRRPVWWPRRGSAPTQARADTRPA